MDSQIQSDTRLLPYNPRNKNNVSFDLWKFKLYKIITNQMPLYLPTIFSWSDMKHLQTEDGLSKENAFKKVSLISE